MRPITWLHLSDFHMRVDTAWAQDVVLRAQCDSIERVRQELGGIDFVLVTGDIAFSGTEAEYAIAEEFLDAITVASGLTSQAIYCVPGNHDVERSRQTLCFHGGRSRLLSESEIDELLAGGDNLNSLLERQTSYRSFQERHFGDQGKTWTSDGLAYVSTLAIDDVRLAIVGLNSAWLAEGGSSDRGQLLVGERQVINALAAATKGANPHVIIGIAHHPIHVLRDFDRRVVQRRIEDECHFFHCGHLHEPEARVTGQSSPGCLSLGAGASYETRQSQNTFSVVTLDLVGATRTVRTLEYLPNDGFFAPREPVCLPYALPGSPSCSTRDLALAISRRFPHLGPRSHYLAALLVGRKTEVPIRVGAQYALGSPTVIHGLEDSEFGQRTLDFLAFTNVLRVLAGTLDLAEILALHGAAVQSYGEMLAILEAENEALAVRVEEQEADATTIAPGDGERERTSFTDSLLADLANDRDWDSLRETSSRHISAANPATVRAAKRGLALALANSEETADHEEAAGLYRRLAESPDAVPSDYGNLLALLIDNGELPEAEVAIFEAVDRFPQQAWHFCELGQRVVEATGSRDLRDRIEIVMKEHSQ